MVDEHCREKTKCERVYILRNNYGTVKNNFLNKMTKDLN